MKKLLLSVVLIFGAIFYSNAQVIDIIGVGLHGKTTETLSLTDASNIDFVKAGSIYSWNSNATINDVSFSDVNGSPLSGDFKFHPGTDITNYGVSSKVNGAYYTALFQNPDNTGITINVHNNQELFMHSFYAFVYRDIPTATYKSYANLETVFFYKKGSDSPYIYEFDIDKASSPRNITVKIPISELQDDNRVAIIDIQAGGETHHAEVTTYDVAPYLGNSFFLGEYTLTNVSGDVDKVSVSIYSPTSNEAKALGYSNPDSFYVNGIIVDVDKVYEGCTLTQGYWKTHSNCKAKGPKRDDTWDLILPSAESSEFFNSRQDYCDVFDTNPNKKNGKYYILAHQYIAAELNLLAGANPSAIQTAFDEATAFLNMYTPEQVKGNSSLEAECVRLGGILDDFNNGRIGPGHCDDDEASIEPVKQERSKVAVYPNPATTYGKIAFTSKQNAKTTAELFNLNGQKVATLFNEKVKIGVPITIEYNVETFKKGLYFVVVRNGSDVYTEKVSIIK